MKKRSALIWKTWHWLTLGGVGLLGLLAAFYYFPPPFLMLSEIVMVHPPRTLSEAALIQVAGLKLGQNLVLLSLPRVRENIKHDRWISEVKLTKSFPGRLLIDVQEEVPIGAVAMGDLYYVNQDGTLFKKMAPSDPKDLPVITGFTADDLEKDERGTREMLRKIGALLGQVARCQTLRGVGIAELHWEKGRGVSLFTMHPYIEVALGSEDWGEKLARLDQSSPTLGEKINTIASIDLDYKNKIVIK